MSSLNIKKASKKASNNSNILKFKIIIRISNSKQKIINFDYNIKSDKPNKIAKELVTEKIISEIDQKDYGKSIKKLIKTPELYYTSFKSGDNANDNSDENIYVKYKRIGQKAKLPYAKKLPKGHVQIELIPKDESDIVIVDEYELIIPGEDYEKHHINNLPNINLRHTKQKYNEQVSYKPYLNY